MLSALGQAVCYEIMQAYFSSRPIRPLPQERKDRIFQQFLISLHRNFRVHREVAFYAGQQCLTPRYFSTVVREKTGRSALRWITATVVAEAKKMLSDPALSVKEIADALGFPNQSFFRALFQAVHGHFPDGVPLGRTETGIGGGLRVASGRPAAGSCLPGAFDGLPDQADVAAVAAEGGDRRALVRIADAVDLHLPFAEDDVEPFAPRRDRESGVRASDEAIRAVMERFPPVKPAQLLQQGAEILGLQRCADRRAAELAVLAAGRDDGQRASGSAAHHFHGKAAKVARENPSVNPAMARMTAGSRTRTSGSP